MRSTDTYREPDADQVLARRWRGIRRALRWWLGCGAIVAAVGLVFGWETFVVFGVTIGLMGVCNEGTRTLRTLRLAPILRLPPERHSVAISVHYRSRYRLPDLEIVGVWPLGSERGGTPPLSVRVESIDKRWCDRHDATVLGRLAPGERVLLIAGDKVVWTVRRVKDKLPRRLGGYSFCDDD